MINMPDNIPLLMLSKTDTSSSDSSQRDETSRAMVSAMVTNLVKSIQLMDTVSQIVKCSESLHLGLMSFPDVLHPLSELSQAFIKLHEVFIGFQSILIYL